MKEDPVLDDELAALIEAAQFSVDMAIYDFDRELVMDSVEAAWEHDQLRVVADEDEADDEGFEFLEDLVFLSSTAPVVVESCTTSLWCWMNRWCGLDPPTSRTRGWSETAIMRCPLPMRNWHPHIQWVRANVRDQAFGRSKDDVLSNHSFSIADTDVELYFSRKMTAFGRD